MKQKKDKAETAKAIFSKENLGFINEPDLVETSKLRLNALANALECMYIDVDDNADDSNLCTNEANNHSNKDAERISALLTQDELDKFDDEVHQAFKIASGDITKIRNAINNFYCLCRNLLPETRKHCRVIYPIYFVVFISIFAGFFGAKYAREVSEFYNKNKLKLSLLVPDMPPVEHKLSKSTVAKARVGLNESALTEIFKFFFSSTAFIKVLTVTYNDDKYLTNRDGLMPTLAFDGQEMKATYRDNDPNRKHKGAVITTVINCNDRTVAIYKIAQKKNQESGCFLLALKEKLIDITNCVVMSDALNSRCNVTMAIAEAGGFFLMPLKNNQGNKALNIAALDAFAKAEASGEKIERQVYLDIDHGRIEESIVEVLPLEGNIDDNDNPHKYGKVIVKYTKNVINPHADGKETVNTRIYISNLEYEGEKTAKQCLSSILDYWMVEAHHYTLDTSSLNQDRFHAKKRGSICFEAFMNKSIVNVATVLRNALTKHQCRKRPLTYKETFEYMRNLTFTSFWGLLSAMIPALE